MRVVLFNDEGQSIASFDHVLRSDDRNPAQAFAVLDLVEKLLETARRDRGETTAIPHPAAAVSTGAG
jgi:hypothetical protein